MNEDNIKNAKNFDELLDIKYGKTGAEKRDNFEEKRSILSLVKY